ncbi:hypothetical protein LIA77_02081 [Sarocladium implicatum]|nr:hypothetical protein LIA77_02081 [Sarocladium implicatum]
MAGCWPASPTTHLDIRRNQSHLQGANAANKLYRQCHGILQIIIVAHNCYLVKFEGRTDRVRVRSCSLILVLSDQLSSAPLYLCRMLDPQTKM